MDYEQQARDAIARMDAADAEFLESQQAFASDRFAAYLETKAEQAIARMRGSDDEISGSTTAGGNSEADGGSGGGTGSSGESGSTPGPPADVAG